MTDEKCMEVVEGEGTEGGHGPPSTPPRPVFLVPTLDDPQQRQQVLTKVQECLTEESPEAAGPVIYVAQVGWEETGQVRSLTSHLLSLCRAHFLLPSELCILLSQHDQYQAIQLCLARINKVRRGEFVAAASDVLDVWNTMYKETVEGREAEKDHQEKDSHDPMKQEMAEVMEAYRMFLSDSLCVDHFKVFECLQRLLRDDPSLFRKVFCQHVYVIEGLEELPLMERALLKLISEDSRVYRVSTELPFPTTAPLTPSALDISGIHETTIVQTPCRHDSQPADTTEGIAQDSQQTHSQQTNDDQKETITPRKEIQMEGDHWKTTDSAGKEETSEEVTQEEEDERSNTSTPANTETPRNMAVRQQEMEYAHTPSKPNENDITKHNKSIIKVEGVDETLVEVINKTPQYPSRVTAKSESEAYVERLFLAHVRLLINTRDELALTLACSMPGREISEQGFTDIRQEAQRKGMPMYQTIVSFILRKRLGGKGYQPEPDNPVQAHTKPLGEFVDALMKLQNILEAQSDARQGATRILCGIKTGLSKMKGCMLKRKMIEDTADRLVAALGHLVEAAERDKKASTSQESSEGSKPSALHPTLKHLIRLCDAAGGQAYSGGVVDALEGDLLTQLSSSKKETKTPLRVPSVLTLFRSPAVADDAGQGEDEEEDLETRVKRRMGESATAPEQPKRYKSDCSWAPIDMSPIDADKVNLSFTSPIAGPSLKAVGKAARRPAEDWREIVASVTQEEESASLPHQTASPVPKAYAPATKEAPKKANKDDCKPKKSRSKRSLLKDISNMGAEREETKGKKKSAAGEEGAKKKREPKTKPLLKGQRSITSFFKT